MQDTTLVPGKVDWRGRPAKKDKHGGTFNSLFVLGNRKIQANIDFLF